MAQVVIAGTGTYLPGEPIPFDQIDTVLGELNNAPPRIQKWMKSTGRVMKELLEFMTAQMRFIKVVWQEVF